jgi:hypothetical protein
VEVGGRLSGGREQAIVWLLVEEARPEVGLGQVGARAMGMSPRHHHHVQIRYASHAHTYNAS